MKKYNPDITGDRQTMEADERNLIRVRQLIEALTSEGLDPALRHELDQWFASPASEQEKERVIAELLYRDIIGGDTPVVNPDEQTRQRFAELSAKLDLPLAKPAGGKAAVRPIRRRIVWRVAAVLIPFVAIAGGYFAGWFGGTTQQPGPMVTVATVDGVNKDTYLADSTHVWVNENSTLTYPETFDTERRVQLSGTARFDVAPDTERPFSVETEHLQVRVLGTDFQVKENSAENFTEVVLYRGSVEVAADGRIERLSPGDRLTYSHISKTMEVQRVETETIPDWRTEIIIANRKTVTELLGMIANYYDVEIRYNPAAFGQQTYMLTFDKGDHVEKVLEVLAGISGEFHYTLSDDKRTIDIDKVN